jgi:hypothetical protein
VVLFFEDRTCDKRRRLFHATYHSFHDAPMMSKSRIEYSVRMFFEEFLLISALHLALFVARDDVDVLNKLLALLLPHCNDECLALKTLKGQMTARELAASLNLVSQFELRSTTLQCI